MAEAIKHTLPDLLRQRIFGLALGLDFPGKSGGLF
jgi:hypothetical protein